jgi:hypothetical protein
MSVEQAPPRSKLAGQNSPPVSSGRGYLALTAALYPDGDAISAEILEFDIASWGHDPEQAYEMIVEAVAGAIEAAYHDPASGLDAFLRQAGLTVYSEPPQSYRPAAIPSHLLSQRGLTLRPVSISIEAAIRN